jgi:hypothetical protein
LFSGTAAVALPRIWAAAPAAPPPHAMPNTHQSSASFRSGGGGGGGGYRDGSGYRGGGGRIGKGKRGGQAAIAKRSRALQTSCIPRVTPRKARPAPAVADVEAQLGAMHLGWGGAQAAALQPRSASHANHAPTTGTNSVPLGKPRQQPAFLQVCGSP